MCTINVVSGRFIMWWEWSGVARSRTGMLLLEITVIRGHTVRWTLRLARVWCWRCRVCWSIWGGLRAGDRNDRFCFSRGVARSTVGLLFDMLYDVTKLVNVSEEKSVYDRWLENDPGEKLPKFEHFSFEFNLLKFLSSRLMLFKILLKALQ